MSRSEALFAPLLRLLGRNKKSTLSEQIKESLDLGEFDKLEWNELLALVTESFRLLGYKPFAMTSLGMAPGADVLLRRGGFKLLVRCREWKDFRVGKEALNGLQAAILAHKADHAVILTSGRFTSQAQLLSQRYGIDLVEGNELLAMLRSAKSSFNSAIMPLAPTISQNLGITKQ